MSLGSQGFASSLLVIHLMLLLCTSAFSLCFLILLAYDSTHFFFYTTADLPYDPPPSIWDTNTSPLLPHCGVCLDTPSPALPLPSPTPNE
jgi:hypothetical protein